MAPPQRFAAEHHGHLHVVWTDPVGLLPRDLVGAHRAPAQTLAQARPRARPSRSFPTPAPRAPAARLHMDCLRDDPVAVPPEQKDGPLVRRLRLLEVLPPEAVVVESGRGGAEVMRGARAHPDDAVREIEE